MPPDSPDRGVGYTHDLGAERHAPALMGLLGRWNWWLPPSAARLLKVAPSRARTVTEPA